MFKIKKYFFRVFKQNTYQFALNGPCFSFWIFWLKLLKQGLYLSNWSSEYRGNPIRLKWILYSVKTMIKGKY